MSHDKGREEKDVKRAGSPEPNWVSKKSDSCAQINISDEPARFDPSGGKDHLYHNQSRCGVCEQVLRDPVSISYGHSFCRQCINTYWDQSRPSENYDCPQCRKTSRTYPVLQTYNIIGRSRSADSVQYYTQKAQQEKTRDLQKPVDDKLRRF
ncbi:tripartite motif-containing protein 43B-like [Sinocyclocheilus rhinocerous]|uniref:tripartite motif-containing protein 43B-like n=1 Tax=Sinocyclocheilus rhinocerous TaxID=307959 RepID=UPI0007B95234|nr:PREDICTED: tripartite motif-containing protein 43B-like [Sinocyclocheilus rhinocerous]